MDVPERGDLVTLTLNPQAGHEQAGVRPCIVLSPKKFNRWTGFASVCPITRNQMGDPFEVELPDGLSVYGLILTNQFKKQDT